MNPSLWTGSCRGFLQTRGEVDQGSAARGDNQDALLVVLYGAKDHLQGRLSQGYLLPGLRSVGGYLGQDVQPVLLYLSDLWVHGHTPQYSGRGLTVYHDDQVIRKMAESPQQLQT